MEITISKARLRPILFAVMGVVVSAGLAVEVLRPIYRLRTKRGVVPFFSLSYEQNFPTWYTSALLLVCAMLLAVIACGARRERWAVYWWGLFAAFVYISLDEVVSLHEAASGWIQGSGVLRFSWVIPATGFLVFFGIAYLKFLAHLPRRIRNQFLISGGIYVAGAVVMELPLGWWTDRAGSGNLVYGLLDLVEEAMEMLGLNLFLLALVEHLGALRWTVGFAPAPPPEEPAGTEPSP